MQSIDSLFVGIDGASTPSQHDVLSDSEAALANELTDDDKRAIVQMHNAERAKYGLQPLQWSESLERLAAQWCSMGYFGHWDDVKGQTRRALGSDYFEKPRLEGGRKAGESLAVWTNRPPGGMSPGAYGTQLWLDEKPLFDCATGQCKNGALCGHYRQLLLEPARQIGCALQTFPDGVDRRSWKSNVSGYPNVQLLVCQYDRIQSSARPFAQNQCPRE